MKKYTFSAPDDVQEYLDQTEGPATYVILDALRASAQGIVVKLPESMKKYVIDYAESVGAPTDIAINILVKEAIDARNVRVINEVQIVKNEAQREGKKTLSKSMKKHWIKLYYESNGKKDSSFDTDSWDRIVTYITESGFDAHLNNIRLKYETAKENCKMDWEVKNIIDSEMKELNEWMDENVKD
jgi:hypothetical protein